MIKTAADSLLPIVQSQRERFRLRATELETVRRPPPLKTFLWSLFSLHQKNLGLSHLALLATCCECRCNHSNRPRWFLAAVTHFHGLTFVQQCVAYQQQAQLLTNEMDKLRSDNVKLYEKIKFLQAYPTKVSTNKAWTSHEVLKTGGELWRCGQRKHKCRFLTWQPLFHLLSLEHTKCSLCLLQSSVVSDDTESRYSSQYEERLDPFSSFSKKERQRKYMNLKPYDKITLSMVSNFLKIDFRKNFLLRFEQVSFLAFVLFAIFVAYQTKFFFWALRKSQEPKVLRTPTPSPDSLSALLMIIREKAPHEANNSSLKTGRASSVWKVSRVTWQHEQWSDEYLSLVPCFQGRFIMGNKMARTITFFYTLLLHILVFLVSCAGLHFVHVEFLCRLFVTFTQNKKFHKLSRHTGSLQIGLHIELQDGRLQGMPPEVREYAHQLTTSTDGRVHFSVCE